MNDTSRRSEQLKSMAVLCLVLGGILLMGGAVFDRWTQAATALGLASTLASLVLAMWAQRPGKR
jgi:hypothetical protein